MALWREEPTRKAATGTAAKVCIIGAGVSGFTTAKRLTDHGIDFDCFEMSDDIGGNWYYKNPNGLSACYSSLHIDTSKWRMAFEDYPVPADWPDFPHHSQVFQYFTDYVEHFGLRERITFNTAVEHAHRTGDGRWRVRLSDGRELTYDALVVANGHHWKPRMPQYPGTFDGELIHSHSYRHPGEPVDMYGKRIVVVGLGNSGLDIASELSQRFIAEKLWVSARRGVWVLSKYRKGVPADKLSRPPWMPRKVGLAMARRMIKKTLGPMENYGLPEPDHEPLSAHPSVSGEFLTRVGSGDIGVKPAISELAGRRVRFTDGSVEDVDVVVCATGYEMSFPFFDDPDLRPDERHRLPLFKRMIKPGVPNLFYVGFAQPNPTLVNFAEQQSKLIAALLKGWYVPPTREEMLAAIERDERDHLGQFYDSPRHTIQVDFNRYVADLRKELARGAKRAAARSH